MKTILFIGNHLSSVGQNKGISEVLAQKLRERGWKIILSSTYKNKLIRFFDMITTVILNWNKYDLMHIDVFSGQAFYWAYICWKLSNILNKPTILSLRGGNLPVFLQKHTRKAKKMLRNAKVVSSPSKYLQVKLADFRKDIKVIHNGIDLPSYSAYLPNNPARKIIWLRAFHKIYNPSLAVRALSILFEKGFDVSITMIGPDKDIASLQETISLAADLGLSNFVQIIPGLPKEQVPIELAKGDIFLNTTNIDNTPVSVIEALACGLCVVSTSVGGIPYLLENEVDSLLVPLDDAPAMAKAIERLITEPDLAAKLSINARRKAEQFDWSEIIPVWEDIFQHC